MNATAPTAAPAEPAAPVAGNDGLSPSIGAMFERLVENERICLELRGESGARVDILLEALAAHAIDLRRQILDTGSDTCADAILKVRMLTDEDLARSIGFDVEVDGEDRIVLEDVLRLLERGIGNGRAA